MRVEVLTVPDCPNGPAARRHLAEALAGRPDVSVEYRVISTADEAVRSGMHGSPTILIDGRDPFAEPGTAASLACRLYRDADGRVQDAPSSGQLREALTAAECPRYRSGLPTASRRGNLRGRWSSTAPGPDPSRLADFWHPTAVCGAVTRRMTVMGSVGLKDAEDRTPAEGADR